MASLSPVRAQFVSDGATNVINGGSADAGGDLVVGTNGPNTTLITTNGGVVTFAGAVIGQNSGSSNNLAIVTGSGSSWSSTSGGALSVGQSGSWNTLLITSGGRVTNAAGTVGLNTGASSNSLTVSGTGSSWTVNDILLVGSSGSGNRLLISNAGFVFSSNAWLGGSSGSSNNEALITGTNSLWSNRTGLHVGNNGSFNRMTISAGGAVWDLGFGNLAFMSSSRSNELLVTGAGSILSNSLLMYVGNGGSGNRMTITNGGRVVNSSGWIGFATTSSNNEAIVTGTNSLWSNRTDLAVGYSGAGNRLTVSNAAVVSVASNAYVGFDPATSSNNLLVVAGGTLRATNAAAGALDIRSGTNRLDSGLVDITSLVMANAAGAFVFNGGTLNVRASQVANGQALQIGDGSSAATCNLAGSGAHSFADGLSLSPNAVLTGLGTITGAVTNSGTLRPGAPFGSLALTGDLQSTASGSAAFLIGGAASSNYSALNVSGVAAFAGALSVALTNGYLPAATNSFTLMTFGSSSGAFTNATNGGTVVTADGNYAFHVTYSATSLVLSNFQPALGITNSSVPAGSLNVAYSTTLGAGGGIAPYSWSLAAGALPGGVTLSAAGVLAGTPTNAGNFNFAARVTDNTGATATKTFSLLIYLAIAGNGEGILHPLSTNTYAVTNGGSVVPVPAGMVFVPAGAFTMNTGTNASNVTIDAYCIGKFHVTCAEYKAFLDANASVSAPSYWTNRNYPAGKASHCVLYVSLTNAVKYCAWVSSNAGWTAIIPSEPQWEKAAKGTNAWSYPWGTTQQTGYTNGVLSTRMNYNGVCSAYYWTNAGSSNVFFDNLNSPYYGQTMALTNLVAYDTNGAASAFTISSSGSVSAWVDHNTWTGFIYTDLFTAVNNVGGTTTPVGTYTNGASPCGAHDMAGQCWDWTSTQFIAVNGAEAGQLVNNVRGGSWYATGNSCRTYNVGEGRLGSGAFNTIGFRIAMIPNVVSLALTITSTSPLAVGTNGVPYTNALAASGGTAPYSWDVSAGALPGGLSMDTNGVVSGTPTNAGAFNFTARVTDSTNGVATNAFALTIVTAPLAITTASPLPGGTVGTAYSQTLAASGGSPGYAWSLSAGTLPGGISFGTNGALSGTPTNAGAFNFTAQVTDTTNGTAAKAFALTIGSTNPVVDHFTWLWTPATANAGMPFAVWLAARDAANQPVTSFNGVANVSAASSSGGGGGSNSPIVITEMAPGSEAQIELQNVSSATVDTTGWFLRINDDTNGINNVNATTYTLPASLAPGELVRVTESSGNTNGGRTYFGSAIAWSNVPNKRYGWIALFDATSTLRDFFAWGWNSSDLAGFSITVNSQTITLVNQWSGPGATPGTGTPGSYTTDSFQRSGTNDSDSTNGWAWFHGATNVDATTLGATNAGLILPWANTGGTPLGISPTNITFSGGQFLGYLTVAQAASAVTLTATDVSNRTGVSALLEVGAALVSTAGDGIPDAWKVANGFDTNASIATLDSDGDGRNNLAEFRAGTDPNSSASQLGVATSTLLPGGQFQVTWPGVAGKLYRLRTSGDLASWQFVSPLILATNTGPQSVSLDPGGAAKLFVIVEIAPAQ
ncbi:MAG: SUMF1/EgtB/PvdO family nonheme iron enzyme [Verrucomicrobia bacterium]|nr:SUMF1/EgtB/PvdO family nonheme iron enzyme [Verrucomicrobiota bacterium]